MGLERGNMTNMRRGNDYIVSGLTRSGTEFASNSPDVAPLTNPREKARLRTHLRLILSHETAAR